MKGPMSLLLIIAWTFVIASAQPPSETEIGFVRILSYSVNTTIETRFSRTQINVVFDNARNCSAVHGFTFQLPMDARVTSLTIDTNNGCVMESTVKEEHQAEEEFRESAAQGKPAALLSAYDSTNYGIQVSLPPLGRTNVIFTFEELLHRKSHQIPFQIPISPGLPVDRLTMDIIVNEPQSGGVSTFEMDEMEIGMIEMGMSETTATAHFEMIDMNDAVVNLPRLIRGFYDAGPIPTEGLLIPDGSGSCFVHLFNPNLFLETTGSLPRNIVFVVDVSGSMSGSKINDAKEAFSAIVEKLTNDDFFAIHTFSGEGVADKWGPQQATADFKSRAVDWVLSLDTGGGTNLNDAYVQAIEQVKEMQTSASDNVVPVVMILSDGQASSGETSSSQISRNVRNANEEVEAKIYALAFGFGADFPLLSGISIQNGGVAARIYEGYGDAATQMENFYIGELGAVIMSDLHVFFNGSVSVESQTRSDYSVFADGSEIAVRARTLLSDMNGGTTGRTIDATTIANTLQGTQTWTTRLDESMMQQEEQERPKTIRPECLQSFAHAKIAELLLFRDAASSIGDEMIDYAPAFLLDHSRPMDPQVQPRTSNGLGLGLVETAEAQALDLALEVGVVWPGLTAMVTVENSICEDLYDANVEVCYDGDGGGGDYDGDVMEDESADMAMQKIPGIATSPPANGGAPMVQYGAGEAASDSAAHGGTGTYYLSAGHSQTILSLFLVAAATMMLS